MKVFCEVPLLNNDDWKQHVYHTFNKIEAFNLLNENQLGIKLRTGGIKAEMFPSTEQVAFVIALSRDQQLPIKFTAGLHHPIRMYREEVHTKTHGFLNIFLAGMLAYHLKLDEKMIEEILSDEKANHFILGEHYLGWKDLALQLKKLRNSETYYAHLEVVALMNRKMN